MQFGERVFWGDRIRCNKKSGGHEARAVPGICFLFSCLLVPLPLYRLNSKALFFPGRLSEVSGVNSPLPAPRLHVVGKQKVLHPNLPCKKLNSSLWLVFLCHVSSREPIAGWTVHYVSLGYVFYLGARRGAHSDPAYQVWSVIRIRKGGSANKN